MAKKANFDTVRSLAFGGISTNYAAVGTPTTVEARIAYITNGTAGVMIFSTSNTNTDGQVVILAGQTLVFNFTSNMIPGKDDSLVLPIGTQFYVKQSTAPTSGAVYISFVYAT